jgi:hypothetical protein
MVGIHSFYALVNRVRHQYGHALSITVQRRKMLAGRVRTRTPDLANADSNAV